MRTEHHKWMSPHLSREMELKVYGDYGKPMLAFPSSNGRFYDYENFGMIGACEPFIDSGKVKIFCVDGIDHETWMNEALHPADKGRRYSQYEAYILGEAVPFIYRHCESDALPIITTGCSLGGYHAANIFFKHAGVFDTAILLSGVYSLNFSVGEYVDGNVYFNDPLRYLANLNDERILGQYRRSRIIVCNGQGPWEEWSLDESRRLSEVLRSKNVDHWLDIWGHDVAHDWPWWRRQLAHHLPRFC
jgi:esterase/lipase superfamily enzyme